MIPQAELVKMDNTAPFDGYLVLIYTVDVPTEECQIVETEDEARKFFDGVRVVAYVRIVKGEDLEELKRSMRGRLKRVFENLEASFN